MTFPFSFQAPLSSSRSTLHTDTLEHMAKIENDCGLGSLLRVT